MSPDTLPFKRSAFYELSPHDQRNAVAICRIMDRLWDVEPPMVAREMLHADLIEELELAEGNYANIEDLYREIEAVLPLRGLLPRELPPRWSQLGELLKIVREAEQVCGNGRPAHPASVNRRRRGGRREAKRQVNRGKHPHNRKP